MAKTPKTTKPAAQKPAAKKPAAKQATNSQPAQQPEPAIAQQAPRSAALPIVCLEPWPLNPRQPVSSEEDDRAIRDLANSIEAQGLISPLLVRDTGRDSFVKGVTLHEVIAGDRRRRALNLLREDLRIDRDFAVPVRIVAWDDAQALLAAGAENLARADMHAMDEALLFENLVKAGMQERDIAAQLGVGERTVYRRRRLCRLVSDAQTAFRAGKINKAQAEALAGGAEDRQVSMLPQLIEGSASPGWIARVMTDGYPLATQALFSLQRYRDAGGTTDALSMEEGGDERVILTDLELFKQMQEQEIADRIGALSGKWPWVDRVDQDEFPFSVKGYARNGGSIRFPGAGALVRVSRDLTRVDVYEDVLKPGDWERWTKAVETGGEEALAEARAAEEAGEIPRPPRLPGEAAPGEAGAGEEAPGEEDSRAPGDASRLMTQPQIEFVRKAQTQALRRSLADHNKAALAWTILVMMGAVSEIQISYAMDAKANEGDEWLKQAFDGLRGIWTDCPSQEELKLDYGCRHVWREKPWLATSCFQALIEQSDARLLDLLAEVAAFRIACWHNPYVNARTPCVSPLNAAVAWAVKAEQDLPEFWKPEKEFWKGYDAIGLKAVLAHADFDPAGLHGAKKGELLATLADVDPEHTATLPELRFLTANDQEDAVIAARAKVLDAAPPPAAADPTPAGDAGADEEREAA
jgi:ParB/RepB/Spo0J family partition protein